MNRPESARSIARFFLPTAAAVAMAFTVANATACSSVAAVGTSDQELADGICPEGQCSGHGSCATVELRPVCTCDSGYAGVVCSKCSAGFHRGAGDACVADEACTEGKCGTHGTCSDSSGTATCTCAAGYTGATCSDCYAGYHAGDGGACVLDQTCLPTTCSGSGTCAVVAGAVKCTCTAGTTGAACESCATGFARNVEGVCVAATTCAASNPCGSHGTCDDATGVPRCVCASGYQGATCTECYPGYHAVTGGTCALDVPCTDTSCSGAGTCNASTGTAVCTCFAGHTGATCSTCATGYHRGSDGRCALDETCGASTCGTHGTCSVTSGVATCACAKGYTGATCAECGPGFHGATGGTCELDQACGATSCGGHGSCVDASGVVVCTCDTGFEGDHCETNSDDCGSNACGTGTCVDRTNDYICLCTDGTWGTSCQ